MQPLKLRGIVVRSTGVGDYNKMLTVLSPEQGKISVWAKGVRSAKSRFAAACSLLCYSEFVVTCRGDAYTLSQATVIESFYHLRDSLQVLSCAIYMADLACDVCKAEAEAAGAVRLLLNSLYFLEKGTKTVPALRAMYEIRLLMEEGFMPALDECVICRSNADLCFLSPEHGGSVCRTCAASDKIRVSEKALCAMRAFLRGDLKEAFTYNCDKETAEEILKINEKFILGHIGMLPKTLDYLKSVGGI